MNLGELLAGIPVQSELPPPLALKEVTGLEYDSRRVASGQLFFAFPGAKVDGRSFAAQAIAKGALAVVSELDAPEGFPATEAGNAAWIRVPQGRQALALAAKKFYGNLDRKLRLTGITGTNGKTTTSFLIDSILRAAGFTTALVGTIEYRLASKVLPAANTTPESLDLHRLFAELDGLGGTHATMEISSHALALGRVYGLEFHTAVFTNLTRDHLDFHQTMEDYFAAKKMLFTGSGGRAPKYAAINRDDEWGRRLRGASPETEYLWYGLGQDAMVRARHIHSGLKGLRYELVFGKTKFEIQSPLIGKINVYNTLAACCAGMTYQLPPEAIARGIASCSGVPGRFERVDEGQPFAVVVD
ncbi:MAG: UDP-N-acetylmuramoyl-L-alanyl-D-glutamate--2,6-diaminopimelate ligase, partial [Acidobacteriota bacterium]|nr:UDP-N-acetylmuramoyl-L-alanyl-D-glutamate--2,6-diaminopimelate ligase [Acidobacteriota bacterium]